jgi:hypothetical protein
VRTAALFLAHFQPREGRCVARQRAA